MHNGVVQGVGLNHGRTILISFRVSELLAPVRDGSPRSIGDSLARGWDPIAILLQEHSTHASAGKTTIDMDTERTGGIRSLKKRGANQEMLDFTERDTVNFIFPVFSGDKLLLEEVIERSIHIRQARDVLALEGDQAIEPHQVIDILRYVNVKNSLNTIWVRASTAGGNDVTKTLDARIVELHLGQFNSDVAGR